MLKHSIQLILYSPCVPVYTGRLRSHIVVIVGSEHVFKNNSFFPISGTRFMEIPAVYYKYA